MGKQSNVLPKGVDTCDKNVQMWFPTGFYFAQSFTRVEGCTPTAPFFTLPAIPYCPLCTLLAQLQCAKSGLPHGLSCQNTCRTVVVALEEQFFEL